MSGTVILAVIIAIVVIAGVAVLTTGGRRSGRAGTRDLRRRFGPEYERLAQRRDDPQAVEQELTERIREHDSLTLRPLAPDERERYVQAWTGAQDRFLDDPGAAARQADQVIVGLLTAIGYPSADRERQLALASVDHAYAVGDYRQACELVQRSAETSGNGGRVHTADGDRGNTADDGVAADPTEALRQAVLHYRVMFNDLLDSETTGASKAHRTLN